MEPTTNSGARSESDEAEKVDVPQEGARDSGKPQASDWVDLFNKAEKIVRGKSVFKRYIDGTPLATDIAVWMADFAEEERAALGAAHE